MMRKILTKKEFNDTITALQMGLDDEISSGDSGHIDYHENAAKILNYSPSMTNATMKKVDENSWETRTVEDTEIGDDAMINQSLEYIPTGMFMVIPDDWTDAENAKIGDVLSFRVGPAFAWERIYTVLQVRLPDLTDRIEALEEKDYDTQIATLNTDIDNLENRATDLENVDYDSRLSALEEKDYESRLTTLEATDYESRIAALEAVDNTQQIAALIDRIEALENDTADPE